jgi:hypothetical protein
VESRHKKKDTIVKGGLLREGNQQERGRKGKCEK